MSDRYKNQETPWRDQEVLRELYHVQGMTLEGVADALDSSKGTVIKWMDKFGVERRSRTEHFDGEPWQDKETLERLYCEDQLSCRQISKRWDCTPKTVTRWVKRHRIKTRVASNTPATFYTDQDGYERSLSSKDKESVAIHRLLLCVENGPYEVFGNETHHKNGVKWDNRMQNIELVNKEDHASTHADERVRDEQGRFK